MKEQKIVVESNQYMFYGEITRNIKLGWRVIPESIRVSVSSSSEERYVALLEK